MGKNAGTIACAKHARATAGAGHLNAFSPQWFHPPWHASHARCGGIHQPQSRSRSQPRIKTRAGKPWLPAFLRASGIPDTSAIPGTLSPVAGRVDMSGCPAQGPRKKPSGARRPTRNAGSLPPQRTARLNCAGRKRPSRPYRRGEASHANSMAVPQCVKPQPPCGLSRHRALGPPRPNLAGLSIARRPQ
jgi:hypothetical protein